MCVNIFYAVGHIRRTDGFLGLYRGLTPRLFSAVISTLVTNAVNTVSITGQEALLNRFYIIRSFACFCVFVNVDLSIVDIE